MRSTPQRAALAACWPALRVAVDGAQSTGKTTLATRLVDHYHGRLRLIPEAARHVAPEFGVRIAEDWPKLLGNPARLGEFFDKEEEWLLAREKQGSFVVDSSVILIQAYREYWNVPKNAELLKKVQYDIVLYCPPVNSYVEDGFRFCKGRLDVDRIYRKIARKCARERLVRLPTGEARFPFAIDLVDRLIAAK